MDNLSKYKLIYLDTNIVSDICKTGNLFNKFIKKYPPGKDYLLSFSTYTLYEVSKSDKFYRQFKKLYSLFPCVIVMSYFPLALKEIEVIEGKNKIVNPIILAPVGIRIEGKNMDPDSLDILLNMSSVKEAILKVKSYTSTYFEEISQLLNHPDFVGIKNSIKTKKHVFIKKFIRYEMRERFLFPENRELDSLKLRNLKSLEVLAYSIYYKFFSDQNRKVTVNDIVDVLIMTTVPYVHTFISERNSIDILKTVQKQTNLFNTVNLLILSDLR